MCITKALGAVVLAAAVTVLAPGPARADGCGGKNCPLPDGCGTTNCLTDCSCGYAACPCETVCNNFFLPCGGQSNPCLCSPCENSEPTLCLTCQEAAVQCTGPSNCPPDQAPHRLQIWFPCPVSPFDLGPDGFGRD